MTKELKTYEVWIPVHEYWIFHVEASSKEEALEKVNTPGHPDVEQKCSISCSARAKTRVKERG